MFSEINDGRLQGKLHQDVCGQLRGDAEGSLDNKEDLQFYSETNLFGSNVKEAASRCWTSTSC